VTAVDCWIEVDGDRFADTAADFHAGTPTALADVEVAWGRATTVDQPEAATARVTVLDRSGGTGFVEAIPIGVPIEVWSSGDVGVGQPTNVAVDGGFETLPLGDAAPRVVARGSNPTVHPVATVSRDRANSGLQAIQVTSDGTTGNYVYVPPAAFNANPSAWDSIPRLKVGEPWNSQLALWRPRAGSVSTFAWVFDSPLDETGATTGQAIVGGVDATWTVISRPIVATADTADKWLGLRLLVSFATWNANALAGLTWADTPGTWVEYGEAWIDDQSVLAPPGPATRNVLVFSGRISDLAATVDDDGTARVQVTAVDQLADLANRNVGDEPWVAEPLSTRAQRIVTLSGAGVSLTIDQPLGALIVTRRDVDSQPAAGLLQELAAGVDGVLWSATHQTTGPYLWIENPARRATLAVLALVGGVVVILPDTSSNAPGGRTAIDGCFLPQGEVTWTRDVTDVLTRVDLTWQEQTTPDLTERNVRVADAASEASGTVLRLSVTTPLTTAADATNVGNRILARSRRAPWRTEGLTWDLALTPPAAGIDTAAALDLLDGTRRLGRGVVVTNVERWPGGSASSYLDGGRYRFDDAGWVLQFVTTPYTGVAAGGPWRSLDPAWRWNQFDPAISWTDLYGVTGPVA